MADKFLSLSRKDRLEALQVAASASGRPVYFLDKDVWVVSILESLFTAPFGKDLVFKGGTSLSKAYKVIRRFSEDIDLTYDIRALIPELVKDLPEALPPNRSQADKWRDAIYQRLPEWLKDKVTPVITKHLESGGAGAKIRLDKQKIIVDYQPLAEGTPYIGPRVTLDFGARSTGEPAETRQVTCDAADHVGLLFPTATPNVMLAQRTFYEKATAAHVYCLQGKLEKADRYSRHWHDLTRLDASGHAKKALADRGLAMAVARHKNVFFRENDSTGKQINYEVALSGSLKLVPESDARKALGADYAKMVGERILLDEAEPFDKLMERCRDLQQRVNEQLKG